MAAMEQQTLSTGNPEIDRKLGGGIPMGSLVLIEGQSDSGKSVFTQQVTWGTLRNGHTISVLTTENTVKSLIRQMQSLNLDILDYLLLRKLSIFPVKAMRAKDGLKALLDAVLSQADHDMVIVDSLTSFIAQASMEKVVSFFEECKSFCNEGLTLAVVAHSHAFDSTVLVRIGSLCDAHLRLSIETTGQKLMKTLMVLLRTA